MRNLLTIIVTVFLTLLLTTGIALAAGVDLFSGTATITIEPVELPLGYMVPGEALEGAEAASVAIEVVDVQVDTGTWDGSTWEATVVAGNDASLFVTLSNPSDSPIALLTYISEAELAPGVLLVSLSSTAGWSGTAQILPGNGTTVVPFVIRTTEAAEGGTLPDVVLKIATK